MNSMLRKFTSVILALILSIGSLQMAVARTAPMPVDEMVICSGEGAYTIAVDAEGNPTEEVHYCPECASVTFAAIDVSAPDLPIPAVATLMLETPAPSLPVIQAACNCPQARGPPLSV